MKDFCRRVQVRPKMWAIAAALLFSSCQASGPAPETARPALWLVSDADSKIYLLGSMHALPRHLNWDQGVISTAIDEADFLVLELAPKQSALAGQIFSELAPRTIPLPVEQRLTPDAKAALSTLPKRERQLLSEKLDDWALMLLLGQRAAREANLQSKYGVEAELTAAFDEAEKPIIGLESARRQLMMFETLDAATQRRLLNQSVVKSSTAAQDVKALLDIWAKGDVTRLEAHINEDIEAAPAAHVVLITDRNQRWAEWTAKQMAGSGTILVAVGAGHMVGPQGLPALMEAKGFQVQRLQ